MRAWTLGATRASIAVASASLMVMGFMAQGANAGLENELSAPLTVVKVVDPAHPAPTGTTFTATVHCDGSIIDTGEPANEATDEGTDTATITFDATGQPTSPSTIGFINEGVCTVTETANGGAKSVSYACEGVQGTIKEGSEPVNPQFEGPSSADVLPAVCATTGPVDPIEVNISEPDQSATVTITNSFEVAPTPPPVVAPEVVAQPTFTG
jgi:hypothetical protein